MRKRGRERKKERELDTEVRAREGEMEREKERERVRERKREVERERKRVGKHSAGHVNAVLVRGALTTIFVRAVGVVATFLLLLSSTTAQSVPTVKLVDGFGPVRGSI